MAQGIWSDRLDAAYAIGSLAHGGFSAHVSDIDCALILRDPLELQDSVRVEGLIGAIRGSGLPLADRTSVFWGSILTLQGGALGGRFPALDRLDLKQFGRLLSGRDIRLDICAPAIRDLVVEGAEFALQKLASSAVQEQVRSPASLASHDVRTATKLVLCPVRFLYTAHTGQVGRNDVAVAHFVSGAPRGEAALAEAALAWRERPPDVGAPEVVQLLENGLRAIYVRFLSDYESRLAAYSRYDLADAMCRWRQSLLR